MPDPLEPRRVAQAALELGLSYVVVTSVTRDDLPDGGADHFNATIHEIRTLLPPNTRVEVLIPDFKGDPAALQRVMDAQPDVLNHNIETVPSLYPKARPEANYQRSLTLLQRASQASSPIPIKSGIMVGLGETREELKQTIKDLKNHDCDILTIGQYLQPSRDHLPVVKYYHPDEFEQLKAFARSTGFNTIAAGPFVRSSYLADQLSPGCR